MSTFEQPSAFESVLRYLGRPQKMLFNALKGNTQGVVNQAADIIGDTVDAFLPGNNIKEFSRDEDKPEFSDVIGGMQPGIAKSAVDILGGVALDPLTYIPLVGWGAKGLKAAGSAALTTELGSELAPTIKKIGDGIRSTTGNLNVAPEVESAIAKGKATGNQVLQASREYALDKFKNVDPDVFRKARLLIEDVKETPNGFERIGIDKPTKFGDLQTQKDLINKRLENVEWDDTTKEAVRNYLHEAADFSFKQAELGNSSVQSGGRGIFNFDQNQVPGKAFQAPLDYHPRGWTNEEDVPSLFNKNPSAIKISKARSIETPEEFIAKAKDLKSKGLDIFEQSDPAVVWGKYAEQTSLASKKAKTADELAQFGMQHSVSSNKFNGEVEDIIKEYEKAGDMDSALALRNHFNGIAKREGFDKALGWVNNVFKPYATAGAFVPKMPFNTRNAAASIAQVASNDQARQAIFDYMKTVPGSVGAGAKEWVYRLGASVNPSRFDKIRELATKAGGDEAALLGLLEKEDANLAKAFKTGVIDNGFISSEGRLDALNRPRTITDWKNVRDAPQAWSHTTEQSIRMGLFESLLKHNVPADEAAKIVKKTMYDYDYTSIANRRIRDIIPFAQFTMKAVPQFANLAMENSLVGRASVPFARELFTQSSDEHPLPQWLANAPAIPLGSEDGKSEYLTSLGLPFEVASSIPNPSDDIRVFGRQAEQGIVSQVNPALKFGYSLLSGRDPYFGSDFASYDKTPAALTKLGLPENGDVGRYYNLAASSGLTQPISSPINTISNVVDDKKDLLDKILSLTGPVKVASVDDNQALQSTISNYLSTNPEAKQYRTFYSQSTDPDTLAAIEQLKKVKKEIKKRKANE